MYKEIIKKWMLWTANFNSTGDFIQQAFGDEGEMMVNHLRSKFNYLYDRYGSHGVMLAFFFELDGNHQAKLIDFVMDNFRG